MIALAAASSTRAHAQRTIDLDAATIIELNAAFDAGTLTAEQLVTRYLARIAAYDATGPRLHAVIALNPHALETARALDAERKRTGKRSLLHGVPIVLKDNYNTRDMPTTGGSVFLDGYIPSRDAFLVAATLAQLGLGTDTGGSVRGPATVNGIVALTPTHGLLSRSGIIPLALTFDTGGPMARSVTDIAVALGVLAGADAGDSARRKSDGHTERD